MPATTVRPGDVIKRILSGELPIAKQVLEAGEVVERLVAVSQASVGELHRAYKRQIKAEQLEMVGRRRTKQRGMCYDTFRKRTWEAWQLGLIEPVEEGDPIPVGQGFLLSTRGTWPNARVVQSVAISYALTNRGRQEEDAWLDLTTAFKDSVSGVVAVSPTAPAPAPATTPPPAPRPSEPEAEPNGLPEVPSPELPTRITQANIEKVKEHLEDLQSLIEDNAIDYPGDDEFPAMDVEIQRLVEHGKLWISLTQDFLTTAEDADRPSAARTEALEERVGTLEEYLDNLGAQPNRERPGEYLDELGDASLEDAISSLEAAQDQLGS